jgi:hypothetical protein
MAHGAGSIRHWQHSDIDRDGRNRVADRVRNRLAVQQEKEMTPPDNKNDLADGIILPLADDPAMTPAERRALNAAFAKKNKRKGLHAAEPGTGPVGETCKTCAHLVRRRFSNTYLKCGLCVAKWTGGGATDVRARDDACSKWEAFR